MGRSKKGELHQKNPVGGSAEITSCTCSGETQVLQHQTHHQWAVPVIWAKPWRTGSNSSVQWQAGKPRLNRVGRNGGEGEGLPSSSKPQVLCQYRQEVILYSFTISFRLAPLYSKHLIGTLMSTYYHDNSQVPYYFFVELEAPPNKI